MSSHSEEVVQVNPVIHATNLSLFDWGGFLLGCVASIPELKVEF